MPGHRRREQLCRVPCDREGLLDPARAEQLIRFFLGFASTEEHADAAPAAIRAVGEG